MAFEKEKAAVSTYQATIERLEPDIAHIDASAGWASIAISLKRLADTQEQMLILMQHQQARGYRG